jgi:anaerobic selenocysteine-containing dehydrogenase
LERAHAEVSWEEALDKAVEKIGQLSDIESDKGKYKLGLIIDELKLV